MTLIFESVPSGLLFHKEERLILNNRAFDPDPNSKISNSDVILHGDPIAVHHFSIVGLLTLISASLLLSKPRTSAANHVVEADATKGI